MNAQGYFIAALIGAVVTFVALKTCNVPAAQTETVTVHDTTIVTVTVPHVEGSGAGKIKYVYLHGKTDTILERVYITTSNGDTVKSFTATLDTIDNKDTIKLSYTYPENQFSYWINRAPLAVPVVSSTTTKTVYVEPKRLTVGIQAGAGYVQPLGGIGGIGAYGGIGIGYTLY